MLACKNLTTEYRINPVGMDVKRPRFSWQLLSDKNGTVQQSYRVVVRSEEATVWDTDSVVSDKSVLVEYGGEPLEKSSRYRVEVSIQDNHGDTANTDGIFETGLLSHEGFIADWITHTLEDEEEACPVFTRTFELEKKIAAGRIYSTALGVYELALNDRRVGNEFFAPGWTSYRHRLQYQTYDVTGLLRKENTLNITVGNGWYKGVLGFAEGKNFYGDRAAILVQLQITYDDGTEDVIVSDESWTCSTGSIRYSEIYHGETIDAGFIDDECLPVKKYNHPKDILKAQECEPVCIVKRVAAVELIHTPAGETVIDFGQNLTGFVEVTADCSNGTEIIVRHAEVLDKHGNFYVENLRTARCTDRFICSGEGDTFAPHFTFHGFRYIAVDGLGESPDLSSFTGCVLHTDMEQTGSFSCSHDMVNQLQHNIEWGQRGNFLDVPTDCPQRDERLGWTGDAQVFARTAAHNMNVALFFAKWLRDLSAEQTPEQGVPHVIPNILGDSQGAAAWGDAAAIIPWTMYLCYGDTRLLEEQYESMRGWVEYIRSQAGDTNLWQTGFQFGDWLALDKEEGSGPIGATDRYFVASAFYAYSTDLVRRAAEVLGHEDDYKTYTDLHNAIVKSFQREYVTETGRLVSETQTACILSLHFGLVEKKHRPRIIKTLKTNLLNHKNHLVTGFVGTPYICNTLSENGLHDLAGKLLLKTDYPSWLYAVTMGATTIWERWNGILPNGDFETAQMNSFNHYAYGSIGDWLYRKVAGIDCIEPGYRKLRIAPQFVMGITSAKGTLKTMYGVVASSWSCENGTINVDIEIPANCSAVMKLPEKLDEITVGSGSHHFSYPTDTDLEIPKYTMDSTLAEILDAPGAADVLEKIMPGFVGSHFLGFMKAMSLEQLSVLPTGPDRNDLNSALSQLNQIKP